MQAWSTVSHEKPTGQCRYPHSGRGVRARNGPPSRVERYVPHSLRRARGSERRSAADTGGCTTCPARTRRRMRARQPRPRRPRRRRGRQSSTRRRAACRRFGSRRCTPSPSPPRSRPSGSPVVPTNPFCSSLCGTRVARSRIHARRTRSTPPHRRSEQTMKTELDSLALRSKTDSLRATCFARRTCLQLLLVGVTACAAAGPVARSERTVEHTETAPSARTEAHRSPCVATTTTCLPPACVDAMLAE